MNVLLGITGSIAATSSDQLVQGLLALGGIDLRIVTTRAANAFVSIKPDLLCKIERFKDTDELGRWINIGDPIMHIDLLDWANVLIICPMSANTLSKISVGICDNLLTCIARGWDAKSKPFIAVPAMDGKMWKHPVTDIAIEKLRDFGICVMPTPEPPMKPQTCGSTTWATLSDIISTLKLHLERCYAS
jgi:phosphopantothenoylcysteine decarboxylase